VTGSLRFMRCSSGSSLVFLASKYIDMVGLWYKIPLLRVLLTSCMLGTLNWSLEFIVYASPLGFFLGLLGNLPHSTGADATSEPSLTCYLALSFTSCVLVDCICSRKDIIYLFLPLYEFNDNYDYVNASWLVELRSATLIRE
jgi:hypothetical protein